MNSFFVLLPVPSTVAFHLKVSTYVHIGLWMDIVISANVTQVVAAKQTLKLNYYVML